MQAICKVSEISENGKEFLVTRASSRVYIMLFQRDGQIHAYDNVCPHQGRPLNWGPDEFLFSKDNHLVCAQHGASFELDTGLCIEGPCQGAKLRKVNIRIEDESVWLDEN